MCPSSIKAQTGVPSFRIRAFAILLRASATSCQRCEDLGKTISTRLMMKGFTEVTAQHAILPHLPRQCCPAVSLPMSLSMLLCPYVGRPCRLIVSALSDSAVFVCAPYAPYLFLLSSHPKAFWHLAKRSHPFETREPHPNLDAPHFCRKTTNTGDTNGTAKSKSISIQLNQLVV